MRWTKLFLLKAQRVSSIVTSFIIFIALFNRTQFRNCFITKHDFIGRLLRNIAKDLTKYNYFKVGVANF